MADAVERLDGVAEPDRVQATPLALSMGAGEHPGVDLKVQVAVRVTGTGGVVPHRHRLDPLHRHLHLPAARPHPRRGVLGDPGDDLLRGPVLRGVVGRRHLGNECGGQ